MATGRGPDGKDLGNHVTDQDVVSVDEDIGAIEPAPADDYYDPTEEEQEPDEDATLDDVDEGEAETDDDLSALDQLDAEGLEVADGASYSQEMAVKETALAERRREANQAAMIQLDPALFAAAEQRLFDQIASGETLHRAQQRIQEAVNRGLSNQGFDMQG